MTDTSRTGHRWAMLAAAALLAVLIGACASQSGTVVATTTVKNAPAGGTSRPDTMSQRRLGSVTSQALKSRFTEFVDLCRAGDRVGATGLVLYTGPDTSRSWRDSCIDAHADEHAAAAVVIDRMLGLLKTCNGYAPISFQRGSDGHGEPILMKIRFLMEGGTAEDHDVAFVEVSGRYYVLEIS